MTTTNNKNNKGEEFKHIRIKGQKEKTYLSDLSITTKGRIINSKKLSEFTSDDQISFTLNAMFLTMLNNEQYKMLTCKVLSEISYFSFEYLLENAHLYKQEMNTDSVHTKEERGDLIIKIGNRYFLVEMDMNNMIFRNIDYSDRVYRINELRAEEYSYPEICYIGFENFSFKDIDEGVMVFHMQTDRGVCLIPRTYVLVFLPKLLKKWYDNEVDEELRGFYKTILTMYETSRRRALEYAKGDEIMEKYLEISKEVQNKDNGLWRSYDHERAAIESYKFQFREEGMEEGMEEGRKEGRKEGIEQGKKETRLENAKAFIGAGVDRDIVISTLNLSEEEINQLDE